MLNDRAHALELDAQDPLSAMRQQFHLPAGIIYLDGNSLGPLPLKTPERIGQVLQEQWGQQLIGAWNQSGWIRMPQRVGDKIAQLIGAAEGQVLVADSTSINLYKALHAALSVLSSRPAPPKAWRILTEESNFPTDLYMAQSVADACGAVLQRVPASALIETLRQEAQSPSGDLGVVMLTHVDYRSGAMLPMKEIAELSHRAGALSVWDLAHSAGALPLNLLEDGADFAVGCGYKYLNGGPGAPAFIWVRPQHLSLSRQPLTGWLGHAAPFAFDSRYDAAPGMARFLCGTPPILSLAALECGVEVMLGAQNSGGMTALRNKSMQLGQALIEGVDRFCSGHDLVLASPRDPHQRGSQVSWRHPQALALTQALIARGVVGDHRAPDLLRLGLSPAYLRFVDVWDAVQILREVLELQSWRDPAFQQRHEVT